MSWDQPVCDACWAHLNPGREPARVTYVTDARCWWCGERTRGIWVRLDPATVPHPRRARTPRDRR